MGAHASKWASVILPLREINSIQKRAQSFSYTPTLKVFLSAFCKAFRWYSYISSLKKKQQRVTNSFSSVSGLTPQSVSHSPLNPSWIPLSVSQNSSQINIDSGGHSSSLPQRSEPHWGQTRSSRPPSPPGLWYHQTAPGRRCLWSARWRHVPRWWRHGPTSPRSASHTPLPASLLPGGSPKDQMRWDETSSCGNWAVKSNTLSVRSKALLENHGTSSEVSRSRSTGNGCRLPNNPNRN